MTEGSDDAPERIAKALSRAGVASRRDAERMVAEGRVRVNGRVIDAPATLVTAADRIEVDGTPLAPPEPPRLWLFHKPPGVVTTARDEKGRPTVFDVLPAGLPRVMTIGRLDLTSEGLLLLTNDGGLKRRLELPATGWTRRYRVRVNGRPSDAALEPLRAGLVLDGERFQPMTVTLDRQQGANAWLTVAIREGRNREIRRAMEAVGLTVNRLIRIGYGPFRLGDLAAGDIEEVRPRVLRDQLGLAPPQAPGKAGGAAAGARGAGRRGPPSSADAAAARGAAKGPGARAGSDSASAPARSRPPPEDAPFAAPRTPPAKAPPGPRGATGRRRSPGDTPQPPPAGPRPPRG